MHLRLGKRKWILKATFVIMLNFNRQKLCDMNDEDIMFDLKRSQKRFIEFCTRFARNYLYQIRRMVKFLLQPHLRMYIC